MSMLSGKAGHDLFVHVLLNRVPDHVSAVLSAFQRFRTKGRVYPTIVVINGDSWIITK